MMRPLTGALCALILLTGGVGVTWAREPGGFPGDVAPIRPIRMEGYWDRDESARAVIGTVTILADRGARRTFGITALQAYKPEEEGVQVLRHSALGPGLRVIGPEEMVQRFLHAPPSEKVTVFGVYRPGSATLTVSSVEIGSKREKDD
jgi:hypothetical protein